MSDLLYRESTTPKYRAMLNWAESTEGLQPIQAPDYHRMQVEHWVYARRGELGRFVMDVGQSDAPRRWVGPGYFTLGLYESDVLGNLISLPVKDGALDGAILTEVLEHCTDPSQAVREVHRALKPGGVLLATSPFLWPWHGGPSYDDYWRFTDQGWELLLKDFSRVKISECEWTDEGNALYDQLRRWECFGELYDVKATTGYLVEAWK